jgi:hypothetical protein
MFTHLRIRNFKAWRDTGTIELAPLTVLFGANSAGKSSLGHLLLLLKQTAASSDRRRVLHTGDDQSLIDLGTFVDCLHGRDERAELEFSLGWQLPEPLTVSNPVDPSQRFTGSHLHLHSRLAAAQRQQPSLRHLEYTLRDHPEGSLHDSLTATFTHHTDGALELRAAPYRLEASEGRGWPLEVPEKFYRISDRSVARYKNADFLATFAFEVERKLDGLFHLGPIRERPRRSYGWSGHTPQDVGARGEHAIACLLASGGRQLSRGPDAPEQPFGEFIAQWLVDMGVIERFGVHAIGRNDYEVRVKTLGGLTEVALPDVGFGVSQVFPALVQAFYCPMGSTVWMEQPEIHLHPQVQAELADVFISAIQARENHAARKVQLVLETHSEHLLNRLQRRIAEGAIDSKDVAVYFARAGAEGAELERLTVNEYGDITNWPDNFFGDDMGDIVARTEAASLRRGNERKA